MKQMTVSGIQIQVSLSRMKNKKLKIQWRDPQTNRSRTVHIGDSRYQNYADKSGLLPQSMLHGDPVRRKKYKARHGRNIAKGGMTKAYLADYILW